MNLILSGTRPLAGRLRSATEAIQDVKFQFGRMRIGRDVLPMGYFDCYTALDLCWLELFYAVKGNVASSGVPSATRSSCGEPKEAAARTCVRMHVGKETPRCAPRSRLCAPRDASQATPTGCIGTLGLGQKQLALGAQAVKLTSRRLILLAAAQQHL